MGSYIHVHDTPVLVICILYMYVYLVTVLSIKLVTTLAYFCVPAPPTQKERKGLVKRVALLCPPGMQ